MCHGILSSIRPAAQRTPAWSISLSRRRAKLPKPAFFIIGDGPAGGFTESPENLQARGKEGFSGLAGDQEEFTPDFFRRQKESIGDLQGIIQRGRHIHLSVDGIQPV
jgi:hypothetical protein